MKSSFLRLVPLALLAGTFHPAAAQSVTPTLQEARVHKKDKGVPKVAPIPQQLFGTLPLSTHSEDARKFVELALDKYENDLLDDSLVLARHSTEQDPQFPLGFALVSFIARRTAPDRPALQRAQQLLPRATPQERLLVQWMTNVQQSNLLPAISTMNDLLQAFPNDKHVLYLTGEWLFAQQESERARKMLESVTRLDPDFAPAYNVLGYAYISTGDPDPARALSALQRYAELQPGSPNPEDSLGEVSRFAGDDRASLEHYRAALQIDPLFFSSQLGLGDTLTLMGDYSDAREEYDRAMYASEAPRDTFHARFQKALVHFWEGQPAEGRKALADLEQQATVKKEPYPQFEIGFGAALLAPDSQAELAKLSTLQTWLGDPIPGFDDADRNISLATVWREQARIYSRLGQPAAALRAISRLEALATDSRDLVVENCYESAHGYQLFAAGDYADAVDELSADPRSPLVLSQLALAQQKSGNGSAVQTLTRLKFQRAPTPEWYLATHVAAQDAH